MLPFTMRTLRLWISYDGTSYAGWQRQAGSETIQEHLERAAYLVAGESVTVHGAGRTDAGVHALGQAAHLRLEGGPPTQSFHLAMNSLLPEDIRVLAAREVPAHFHSRFSATGKRYLYRVLTGDVRDPIGRRYAYWFRRSLDIEAMRQAVPHLIGRKDYAAFAGNPGYRRRRPTIRRIVAMHLLASPAGVDVHVQGDGFLYRMVRNLVGSLLEVGRGKRPPGWIREVLLSKDRSLAGPTLPPMGLFLTRVLYPPEFGGDEPRPACGFWSPPDAETIY
ncbi:MAG: tRNA pseudouridine(38-40) synthase TruA [Planctomycetota bacterium]